MNIFSKLFKRNKQKKPIKELLINNSNQTFLPFESGYNSHDERNLVQSVNASIISNIQEYKILDCQSGDGSLLSIINFPVENYYGIDASEYALDIAKTNYPNHNFSKFSYNNLHMKNDKYDFIILNNVYTYKKEYPIDATLNIDLENMYSVVNKGISFNLNKKNTNNFETNLSIAGLITILDRLQYTRYVIRNDYSDKYYSVYLYK